MDKQDFLKEYQDTFKEPGKDVFFSPGRINVIGEHTDYNGGHVFPMCNEHWYLWCLWPT